MEKILGRRHSPGLRLWEGKTEWNEQKQNPRDDDRGRHSPNEKLQSGFVRQEEWRGDKEEIDRHIGQNKEGHERNAAFPGKVEDTNVRTLCRDPEATAINDQKEKRQTGRRGQSFCR